MGQSLVNLTLSPMNFTLWMLMILTKFAIYKIYNNKLHSYLKINIIWATSWENLFMPYANNKGADQPAHPRSLISAFVVHCLDSIIPLVSLFKISKLYLASVAKQAGLSLNWSKKHEDRFSCGSFPIYHKLCLRTWPNIVLYTWSVNGTRNQQGS